jgi:hypothetical protein
MLSLLWIFTDTRQFSAFFKGAHSSAVRQKVIRRGWHHFNMQAVVYVAGLVIFNSLKMPEIVIYLSVGFLMLTALIYANTNRNIKFSEQM